MDVGDEDETGESDINVFSIGPAFSAFFFRPKLPPIRVLCNFLQVRVTLVAC